jgi:hypothetical protein
MACNQHDKDYLSSLEEAHPLSQVEREAKEMTENYELARIQQSERYAEAIKTVGYLELNEKLNDNGK